MGKYIYSGKSRISSTQIEFLFVLTASFFLIVGTYISGTILAPYAKEKEATWFMISMLSGSMYVIRLLFGTAIGKLADRKGNLKVLQYSLWLYPVIAIAYYGAWDIYTLLFARLLHGVASAMMIPMGMAYVGQISPIGKEGKYMSIYNFCTIAASGLGPLLSTWIADRYGFRATFVVLFLLAVLALGIIQFPVGKDEQQKGMAVESEHTQGNLRNACIAALSCGNFILAAVAVLMGFYMLLYLQYIGIAIADTGLVIAIYYVVSGVAQVPLSHYLDKHDLHKVCVASGGSILCSVFLFTVSRSLLQVCLNMVFLALGTAVFQTAVSALSVRAGRQIGMGKTMGFLNTMNSAGMIGGCLLFGSIPVGDSNYKLLFDTIAATLFVLLVLTYLCNRKSKERRNYENGR